MVARPMRGAIARAAASPSSGWSAAAPSLPARGLAIGRAAGDIPGASCRRAWTPPRHRFASGADRARLPHVIRFPDHAPFELEPTAHVE